MRYSAIAVWVCALVWCGVAAQGSEFNVLRPPAGVNVSSFTVRALSADGLTVVGDYVTGERTEAFRWTAETGTVPLGDLPGGEFKSIAYGVSADGAVVVGSGSIAPSLNVLVDEAFRWTAETGIVSLHEPGETRVNAALDISHGGQIILGQSARLWTELEGWVEIDGLMGSRLGDLSPDGSTIIGQASNEGYRWNRRDGLVIIDTLLPSSLFSHARPRYQAIIPSLSDCDILDLSAMRCGGLKTLA